MSAMDDIPPHLPPANALDPAMSGARGLLATLAIVFIAAVLLDALDEKIGVDMPPTVSGSESADRKGRREGPLASPPVPLRHAG